MLRKLPSGKLSGTKNSLFFLLRAPNHHSFFNLQFLYGLKHKGYIFKVVRGIVHSRFRFVFIEFYIFVQQNAWFL